MAYKYTAYGFTIDSDIKLDGLPPSQITPADLRINVKRCVDLGIAATSVPILLDPITSELTWCDVGRCVFDGRAEIKLEVSVGVSDQFAALFVLGPVLALWLHRAKLAVYHGSGVAFRDGCAIFLGDKGAGKSTVAAACLSDRHRLIADDIIAVAADENANMMVQPSSFHIQLAPVVNDQFPLDWAQNVKPPHPMFPKIIKNVRTYFRGTPQTPAAIYVLRRGGRCEIRRLKPTEALQALIRYSYVSRFGDYLAQTNGVAQQLKQCGFLTDRVFELTSPKDVAALTSVVRAVADHLGGPEIR